MAVAKTRRRLTADEYFALDLPERPQTQLIDGEIIVNEPSFRHQRILLELVFLLTNWCRAEPGRGEAMISVDVHLDEYNVYAPDVWWVPEERRQPRDARRLVGPPDLAVEVRSPSTWRYDVAVKREVYERTGLSELWLVDTESDSVLVYRRSSAKAPGFDVALEVRRGESLTTPLMPGLSIDLDSLFDR